MLAEDMSETVSDRGRYSTIPPTSALIAFECAARHGNFTQAAIELATSQSAISRHMARLEKHLGAPLFERSRTGVRLTEGGRRFRDAVVAGFGALRAGAAEVETLSRDEPAEVTIACSDEVSQLFLMPRYRALTEALGRMSVSAFSSAPTARAVFRPNRLSTCSWPGTPASPHRRTVFSSPGRR